MVTGWLWKIACHLAKNEAACAPLIDRFGSGLENLQVNSVQ
jgi:hypothetical protein